jgi:hypothetical protein
MTQVVTDKSLLLKTNDETMHVVPVNPDDPSQVIEVWVRDISFLDIQDAAQKMVFVQNGEISLSLKAYWEHAFSNWIVRTNPALTSAELLSLKGPIGEAVSRVLPQPNEIAEAMQGGFMTPSE